MFGQGAQAPLIKVQWFVQSAFSMANILKSILCVKTGKVEMNHWIVIEKWYNRWLRLLTMLLLGRIYIALSPCHFVDFRNIFLPNRWRPKKPYDLSLWPLAGTESYYGNSGSG